MISRKNWALVPVIPVGLMILIFTWVQLGNGGELKWNSLMGLPLSIGVLGGAAWIHFSYTRTQNELESVLDSTSEAIFKVDRQGICTFVNQRGIELLGFQLKDELIGKPIHELIRQSVDGPTYSAQDCPIVEMIRTGQPSLMQESVLVKKDGQPLLVELQARPHFKNSQVTGAVVTFTDYAQQKKEKERLNYLAFHDRITGTYNQAYFYEELERVNIPENYPISLIMGDVNELKLVNDIFGHKAGDLLLSRIGSAIQAACQPDGTVARMGGDEFMVILPRTDVVKCAQVLQAIWESVGEVDVNGVRGSISLGLAVKIAWQDEFDETLKNAEEEMYKNKILTQSNIDAAQLKMIMERLFEKNPNEKIHSIEVSQLSQSLAQALELSPNEIRKAKEAGYYHDIGKIALSDDILQLKATLSLKQLNERKKHSVVGYRILNLFNETLSLAQGVLEHHEHWDGTGYPKGLAGEEISLNSRIIAVAEVYSFLTSSMNPDRINPIEALAQIRAAGGQKYDPRVVTALESLLEVQLHSTIDNQYLGYLQQETLQSAQPQFWN